MTVFETATQFIDLSGVSFDGRTLDIGGGGEGIISRIAGDSVIAIDKREDELSETLDIGIKIVMDACDLKFLPASFENVTAFYSLMYMDGHELPLFIAEAMRVLKSGGRLWIWDSVLPENRTADIFVAQLEILLPDKTRVRTGYGVRWDREQTAESVCALCENAGFIADCAKTGGQTFFIRLRKP